MKTTTSTISITSCLSVAVLLGVAAVARAQPESLESSFSDHSLLAAFPDSEIIAVEFEEDINYRIVLGSLQRTRGQVVPEASERLRGDVTKITYEISQEFTGEDVYQFFREQIQEKNYAELFTCIGSACGSSNYWANDIFRNRILYGPERNQYYLAMQTDFGLETDPYIALYIITRGNRRIYAYVEIVEGGGSLTPVNAINTRALLASLREQGSIVLPGISFLGDNQLTEGVDLSYVVDLLQSDLSLQVYLVSHLGGNQPLQILMQRSASRARFLRQQLIELGIGADRMDAQGVGPLAPVCAATNCSERVELVLQ